MALRYLKFTYVNKYHLAKELYEIGSDQAPSKEELDNLEFRADQVKQALEKEYGHPPSSSYYGWSGLSRDIETQVSKGDEWNPRGEYILAGERAHATPNAGEPLRADGGCLVFVVGPTNSGLTDPIDLTAIAVTRATMALMKNGAFNQRDLENLKDLAAKSRLPGAKAWAVDPEIVCPKCGGYVQGASPPQVLTEQGRPSACSGARRRRRRVADATECRELLRSQGPPETSIGV